MGSISKNRQKPSQQPVQRHRRQGTPIVDTRTFAPDDDLRNPRHDVGDQRPYQDFVTDVSGNVVPDATVNPAGS